MAAGIDANDYDCRSRFSGNGEIEAFLFLALPKSPSHHSGSFVKRVPTPFWSALHYMVSAPTFFLLAASICAPAALPKTGLTQTPGDAPIGIRSTACRLGPSSPVPLYSQAFHRHPRPAPLFRLPPFHNVSPYTGDFFFWSSWSQG
jgi:hypothetical protein